MKIVKIFYLVIAVCLASWMEYSYFKHDRNWEVMLSFAIGMGILTFPSGLALIILFPPLGALGSVLGISNVFFIPIAGIALTLIGYKQWFIWFPKWVERRRRKLIP